ncbi:Spermidine synthase [Serratia rubidaea]|uniref:Spermidine synthase n=1 Tax=Serratia rubidaea TaxID=61652 RepID=A0A3S4HZ85_SERRU|nr:Spermidine synthase [Serratia rubidaea]
MKRCTTASVSTSRVEKELYREKTEHQDLVIFENAVLGRVMALDGVVQTTERDEFIYHEMMTHVPLLAHGPGEESADYRRRRRRHAA